MHVTIAQEDLINEGIDFKKGDHLQIQGHQSEYGKGLSYPSFKATAKEDGFTGGWDVWDVLPEKPGEFNDPDNVSVYGFSIAGINGKHINGTEEGKSMHVTLATGEPDQDYDHKFFDEIVKQLARAGFKGATHREWDKYTGVYLKVPGVDRFWIKDYYSTGTRTDKNHKYEYADASLQDDEGGTYSADPSNYFMMEPDEVFEGQTLVLTKMDGTEEMIENPKKKDLPFNVAPKTFSYEKGTLTEYTIFVPENNNDEEIEVSDHNGKVDAYALI